MAVPTDHAYADIDNEVQESNTANTTKRRRTGYACAVADCCAQHSDGVSLHKFPKVQEVRRQWIKFVSTCRADFGSSFRTATENSRICERHFAPTAIQQVTLYRKVSASWGSPNGRTCFQQPFQPSKGQRHFLFLFSVWRVAP